MIEVSNLTIGYTSPIIQSISQVFEDGKVYGIMGPSGCGKTTLLRTIAGLLKPLSGKVLLNNEPLKGPSRQTFMMHQSYVNFPWKTCLQNILFPLEMNDGELDPDEIKLAHWALEIVGLGKFASNYPSELSGGMKQRLALARVLVTKPHHVLMDEPLSALDAQIKQDMEKLILNVHRETKNTIIFVSHNQEEIANMADTTLILNKIEGS